MTLTSKIGYVATAVLLVGCALIGGIEEGTLIQAGGPGGSTQGMGGSGGIGGSGGEGGASCVATSACEGTCDPPPLVENQLDVQSIFVKGPYLYWVGDSKFRSALLDGSSFSEIRLIDGYAVDFAMDDQHAFFKTLYAHTLTRLPLDGDQPTLFEDAGGTYFGDIVLSHDSVYWVHSAQQGQCPDPGLGCIRMLAKDAVENTLTTVIASGVEDPSSLAIDADHLYWNNYISTTSGEIERWSLGNETREVFVSSDEGVGRLAVDETHVYWATPFGIRSKAKSDSTTVDGGSVLKFGGDDVGVEALVVDGDYLYWTDKGATPGVYRMLKSGSGQPTMLASGEHPYALAIDCHSVYWSDLGHDQPGRLLRMQK